MLEHTSFTWLLWEGLVPLFGASGVYLASGFYKRLASPGSVFAWSEAVDSMGWLYGALVLAVQSAVRLFAAGTPYLYAGIGCTILYSRLWNAALGGDERTRRQSELATIAAVQDCCTRHNCDCVGIRISGALDDRYRLFSRSKQCVG